MRDTHIQIRMHLANLVAVIGVAVVCAYAAHDTHEALISERKAALTQAMDMAAGAVNHFVACERDGRLTRAQAQQQALAVVHQMRYGDGNYFWINRILDDHHALRLMNGANDKVVGSIAEEPAMAEFIRMARTGSRTSVDQMWPRPGSSKPVAKIEQVRGVKQWGWIIASGTYVDDIAAAFRDEVIELCAIFVLACAVLTLLGWAIARSIARPLQQATRVAGMISQGHLDNVITPRGRDEAGLLLASMADMQRQLQAVQSAQLEMATRHGHGAIGYRMEAASFPGEFGNMVRNTNALVQLHVDIQREMVRVMGCYAQGNLSEDMPRYQGEQAALSEAMDMVKHNLLAINGEIKRLAAAAAAGDFSVRSDEHAFQNDFKVMISDLNRLMAVSDTGLAALSSVMRAITEGNLSQRMQGEYSGVFATLRDGAKVIPPLLAVSRSGAKRPSPASWLE